jgi:hypothetical protein
MSWCEEMPKLKICNAKETIEFFLIVAFLKYETAFVLMFPHSTTAYRLQVPLNVLQIFDTWMI